MMNPMVQAHPIMTEKPVIPLFLKFFLPLAALLFAGLVLFGQTEIESEMTRLKSQETLNVGLGAGTLSGQIESISRDLAFLSSHSALRRAINAPTADNLAYLAADFANFSRSKGIYDQLRWLDETGMEIVRVDSVKGQSVVIAADKLQNKGSRYFFTDSFKLQPGEVFISPLDLNIEQNKIEVPYKPMVRVATSVVDDQGKKRGIVILNYYGKEMLQAFATATTGAADHIMVVNGEGYWLKSPKSDEEWGFMFKRPELSLAARAPEAWQRIRSEDRGQQRLADGLWTWQTVYPLLAGQKSSTGAADAFIPSRGEVETKQYVWKSVAHLSADVLDAASRGVWSRLAGLGVVLLAVFGFGSWKLAQAWAAQAAAEAEVRRVNAGLEVTVAERTHELHQIVVELDETNAELARKNEEMESMIYTASHDLRSPLVNIQGFSQRLEKAKGDIDVRLAQEDVPEAVRSSLARVLGERMPAALGFIKSSSLKMDSLINGLLRLSRVGRVQLTLQPLDMNTMMHDIVGTLTIQIQQAGASVTVGDLPPCLADAAQINQVFTNLIDNAIKYRDPVRPLTITLQGSVHDARVRYTVADTGLGIAEEFQPKVWQLFHRLDPNGAVAGEGLGLTLVRRILERLHGHITLTSKAGDGSCFTIELPACPASGEPHA
jgi:signal transduction histidine kinase